MDDDNDEKKETSNPFLSHAVCLADLAEKPLPKVEYLVERLALAPGRPSTIYAAAGTGKSVLIGHIAACVALNRKLFGAYEVKAGTALILDAELGLRETEVRLRQHVEGLGARIEDAAGLSFRSFPGLRLDEPDARRYLLEAARQFDLIVIDPLSRSLSCSELDARGVSDAMAMTGEISSMTGCLMLWCAHAGKRQQAGLRGSSTIMDSSQCVLKLTSPHRGMLTIEQVKAVPHTIAPVFLQFEEVGGIAPETKRARGLRLVEYDPDAAPAEPTHEKPDVRHTIIAILEEHPDGLAGRTLRERTKGNTQRYVQSLRVLVAQNIVVARSDPSDGRRYNEVLDEHLLPKFGRRPVRKVDGRAAHALDTELADRAKTTRNNLQIVLRSTLRFAVRQGYLAQMPEGLPKLKRTGQLVLDIPSDADVQVILAEANDQWRLPFMLMAYAGLRPNEVRGLRWRDIRLDEKGGMLTVRRGISFGQVHSPKTGQRDVPIAPPLRDELDDGLLHAPDSPVVFMRDGRLITQTSMNAAFRRLLKKVGLRHWSIYSLRHYAITSWLRAGVPPHVVQRMAGHSSLSTTQRYTHYVEGDLERAGELLGNHVVTVAVPNGPGVRSVAVFQGNQVSRAE